MTNKFYLIAVVFLSVSYSGQAQTSKTEHPTLNTQINSLSDQAKLKDLMSIHTGTYQFRVSVEGYYPLARLDILETVANQRLENTDQLINVDEHTKLFIPSYSKIQDPSFVPLEQMIYAPGDSLETISE